MRKKKDLLKRAVAILMSFAMVAGMFMWNRLDVKAAVCDWYWTGNDAATKEFLLERVSDNKDTGWKFPVEMHSNEIVGCSSDTGSYVYTLIYYVDGRNICTDSVTSSGGDGAITIGSNSACVGYAKWNMTPVYTKGTKQVWTWRLDAVIEEDPSAGGRTIA